MYYINNKYLFVVFTKIKNINNIYFTHSPCYPKV